MSAATLHIFPALGRWYSALVFEPRDLWIGLYWTRDDEQLVFYVCLLPTLVLKIVRAAGLSESGDSR